MAFDYDCLNLDSIEVKPIEENNLEHWQKSHVLKRAMYETWKGKSNKTVIVDGKKYRLVPLTSPIGAA